LTRTSSLGLLVARVVRLDELDQRHLGGVAEALRPELVDAGVAAGAVRELLVLLVEEKVTASSSRMSLKTRRRRCTASFFSDFPAACLALVIAFSMKGRRTLALGQRGLDPAVRDERGGKVGQHRRACSRVTPSEAWCF